MELIKQSLEYNRLLTEATKVAHRRNVYLDAIALGELRLSPDDQERLRITNRKTLELLRFLSQGVVEVKRVVAETDDWGRLPDSLQAPYLNLYERTYGSRALRTVDSDIGKAQAKPRRMRTSSSQTQVRGGAKPGKSAAASVKNVVVDHRAFEFKRTIDRRLRTIASDIRDYLSGGNVVAKDTKICPICSRYAKTDWNVCPYDGQELKTERA